MNTSDLGPQLLYATRHNAIAGNFDVPGNADAYAFFHASQDDLPEAIARKWKVDAILICKTIPTLYLGKNYYNLAHMHLQLAADGLLHLTNIDRGQPLIERLIRGEVPAWLKPIEIPVHSDYLMFRIQDTTGKK